MRSAEAWVLTFLLNALWQIPVLALLGAAADQLLRRAPARHRHALWVAILAAGLLLPACSPLSSGDPPAAPGIAAGSGSGAEAHPALASSTPGPSVDWCTLAHLRFQPVGGLGAAGAVLYVLLLVMRAARLTRAWRRVGQLRHRAAPLAIAMPALPAAACAEVAERCRVALDVRQVEILISPEVEVPMTAGIVRPVILLPPTWPAAASAGEMLAALAHEMAHVRRWDCLVHLLCEVLFIPLAFHPAARLVRRRIAAAREIACDEAAVAAVVPRRIYARALLSIAASAVGPSRSAVVLGVLDAGSLEERMKRLIAEADTMNARAASSSLVAALLVLLTVCVAAAGFAIGIEDGTSEPTSAPRAAGSGARQPDLQLRAFEITSSAKSISGPRDVQALKFFFRVVRRGGASTPRDHALGATASALPGLSKVAFLTREDNRQLQWEGVPPNPVDVTWVFELAGASQAEVEAVASSKLSYIERAHRLLAARRSSRADR